MPEALHFLEQYGYVLVFLAALVEQLGLPIPAAPVLLAAGALAGSGTISALLSLLLASVASVVADTIWYGIGRSRGAPILHLLCRISLETDSCVNQTKVMFKKLGSLALVIAKFVPGLSTVAPPLAGVTRMSTPRFLFLDFVGGALWSGTYIFLGYFFRRQLRQVADVILQFGSIAAVIVVAPLVLYLLFKFWRRQRFIRALYTMRISPEELLRMMEAGEQPSVIDLRQSTDLHPGAMRIPGSIWYEKSELPKRHHEIPRDRDVILYCSCPNEASSASAAMALHKIGVTRVRPLLGGFDEWSSKGYPLEAVVVG